MAGRIYVGIGGWTFEPWRGVFYPEGLTHKRELEHASRQVTSIEINGTYYSSFRPASWGKWRDETPDGFVFAVKGSRFWTNRRVLADAGESLEKFFAQGIGELGDKLGPVFWQFANTKKFDPDDCCRARSESCRCATRSRSATTASRTRASSTSRASTRWRSSVPTTRPFPRSRKRPPTSPMPA